LWYQARRLECELPDALGRPGDSLVNVLAGTLENPRYVYLTRRDRVRQAVSFARAIQTEQWRSVDVAASEPRYDVDAINAAGCALADEEAHWEAFFSRSKIVPHRLLYEDLDASPRSTVSAVLQFLGYEGPLPVNFTSTEHRKQADTETEAWVRRYEIEMPACR
jgi:LPS sulfotransferase NodH